MDDETRETLNRIEKRFDRVDERFDNMDKHFERVDERFDKLALEFTGRLSAIDERFESLEQRLEKSHNEVITILDSVVNELANLHTEYHLITAALARLDDSNKRMHSDVSELSSRLDGVEERLSQLEAATRRDHDA